MDSHPATPILDAPGLALSGASGGDWPLPGRLSAAQQARVQALEQRFRDIERTRMAGLPLCHPLLQVAAVGFAPHVNGQGLVGVLLSSWFMNIVWLPWPVEAADGASAGGLPPGAQPTLAQGEKRERTIGAQTFEFIGARDEVIGAYESCSIFSPMHQFLDQAAALSTAQAVVDLLWQAPPAAARPALPARDAQAPRTPDRRGFLFGRGSG